MKTTISILLLVCLPLLQASGQDKYLTKTGSITFYSHTPAEDILAENHQVTSIIDFSTGGIVFAVLIKSFDFKKALMQEHFNENYMESNTFPKSTFEGKITDIGTVDRDKPGTYKVKVTGDLKIKDVTNKIETEGTLTVGEDGHVAGHSEFEIHPEDYGIEIPSVVRDKIAKTMKVTCDLDYQPFNK